MNNIDAVHASAHETVREAHSAEGYNPLAKQKVATELARIPHEADLNRAAGSPAR